MSEASQQTVTQIVGSNTGQIQAIAAGGNVTATQQGASGETTEQITQEQAVEILAQIEQLLKASPLPSEVVSKATEYTTNAKQEANEEKPEQSIIIKQLERATSVIKKLDTTAGATKDLISKLRPLFVKLAAWLGVAISHFWG
ncbi:hypothetical protein [Microcystis sp. M061S2]|uniref:hypothetical protein n=1 Tax=Microcystis sp. M061S2 TaxID=2771171 RepID=UPI00258C8B22|nr:hypothetical protein [Microcystis sp. M061S2]MCA2656755.1 hypothetical protein [Microcystis sp. M061S2]